MGVKNYYQAAVDATKPHIQTAQEKFVIFFTEAHVRYQNLGNWRIVVILILLFSAYLLFFGDSTPEEPIVHIPPEPQIQQPQKNPLEEPIVQRILLIGSLLLILWALLLLVYDVGKITLSTQSVAHRRNVLFAFSIIILSEVFEVDISGTLGLQHKGVTEPQVVTQQITDISTENNSENKLNPYAYGVLGFFLIYSFIEYVFTFASDYLKSRDEWNANKSASKTDGGISIFLIGIYRTLFDVILPLMALLFVIVFFYDQTEAFVKVALNEIVCQREELKKLPETTNEKINSSLEEISAMCPKCDPAIQDVKKSMELVSANTQPNVKSWFGCD